MNGSRVPRCVGFCCVGFCTGLVVATGFFPLTALGAETEEHSTEEVLRELRQVVTAIAQNHSAQEKAWPQRSPNDPGEVAPPLEARQLAVAYQRLVRVRHRLLTELGVAAADAPEALHRSLRAEKEPALLALLIPLVASHAVGNPTRTRDVIDAAGRVEGCPVDLARALAELGDPGARFLLERGKQALDPALLREAASSGSITAIGELIDLADSGVGPLARISLRALQAINPPSSSRLERGTRIRTRLEKRGASSTAISSALAATTTGRCHPELEDLLLLRIESVRTPEVRAALVTVLGVCGNVAHGHVLRDLFRQSPDEVVRLAALSSLGKPGVAPGEFFLDQLSSEDASLPIKKSCVHALGVSGYRPALGTLVALLDDAELQTSAMKALRRASGKRHSGPAGWKRWWRRQPEARQGRNDPDAG